MEALINILLLQRSELSFFKLQIQYDFLSSLFQANLDFLDGWMVIPIRLKLKQKLECHRDVSFPLHNSHSIC